MPHSSRRSYKDKYNELKQAHVADDVDEHLSKVRGIIELANREDHARTETARLIKKLAEDSMSASRLLDDKDMSFGLAFEPVYNTVDIQLETLDIRTILMRTRDVLDKLVERIGVASERHADLNARLVDYATSVSALDPVLARAQRGYLSSYVIGQNPSADEISIAITEKGKNPRMRAIEYDYDTDEDSSEYETTARTVVPFKKASPTRNNSINIT